MTLDTISQSMVGLRSIVSDDAFTAKTLGTLREGSGVVIRADGLVLTIGYLITEAEEVWLTRHDGQVIAGHALAYDQESGFGLVLAMTPLGVPAVQLGNVAEAKVGDGVILADGAGQFVHSDIVAKQEFAGYWEYLLDEAVFVAPAHPSWGGAALFDTNGKLLGIGSLQLQMMTNGKRADINMVVPINLLLPILDDLLTRGKVNKQPRPWLGAFSAVSNGRVVVVNVSENGPAAQAGLREGDVISEIQGREIEGLADFYRKVWKAGPAGAEIPMRVLRNGREAWLRVKTADRDSFLKKPQLQ